MRLQKIIYLRYFAKLLLAFIVCTPTSDILGDCGRQRYTLIELMNTQDTSIQIFTGKVIKSMKADDYVSLMVITSRIKGNPNDTVLLKTSFFVSAGGRFLEKDSEHLIISNSRNNYYYHAYICDYHSAPLTIINPDNYRVNNNIRGKERLKVIKEFLDYKKNKYSGSVTFKIGDHTVATGAFDKGLATGEWRYFKINKNKELIPFSIVKYDKGILSGRYTSYQRDHRDFPHTFDQIYKDGILQSEKIYNADTYDPSSSQALRGTEFITEDSLSTAIEKEYNEKGIVTYEYTTQTRTFSNHHKMTYSHGYYNISAEHWSFFRNDTLGSSGEYYYGAKVGQWKSHSDDGTLVSSEDHAYPPPGMDNELNTYYRNGQLKETYLLNNNGFLTKILQYNKEGQKTSVTLISEDGSYHIKSSDKYSIKDLSYKNNKSHGRHSYSRLDSTRSSETYYKNGKRHGPNRTYYPNNQLKIKKSYENGILVGEELFYNENGELIHKNYRNQYGCLQGAYKYYNDGRLQREGAHKDGFRVGTWTEYQLSSKSKYSYVVHEYAELREGDQPSSIEGNLLSSVYYDENGKALRGQ